MNTWDLPRHTRTMTWGIVALLSLASIVLVSQFAPYVPDYDGLDYFAVAKTVNSWMFGASVDTAVDSASIQDLYWPITNAVSTYLAAIFMRVVDPNVLPALINTAYLALFAVFLARLRPAGYVLFAVLLLCANTLFFRLFTTLTSEFSVGLWIFAFLTTLVSAHAKRGRYLCILTVVGLLLRTVDVIFVLVSTLAYAATHYLLWRDGRHAWGTVKSVGLTLLLTAPIFFGHYRVAFEYMYVASFGVGAESWKAMAGVSSRLDVTAKYLEYLALYNPLILPGTVATIAGAAIFYRSVDTRSVLLRLALSIAVCMPLMAASSLNIMVVYWVFAGLIFLNAELWLLIVSATPKGLRSPFIINVLTGAALLYGAFFWAKSWAYELPYLRNVRHLSDVGQKISRVLERSDGTETLAMNYAGVGQLDPRGLAFDRAYNFRKGGQQDIYTKGQAPSYYLTSAEPPNFFVAAHDNYFFPGHFGINDHVAEIRALMEAKSQELGFRKVALVAHEGLKFDIWYRPGTRVQLQYASYGDKWIGRSVPVHLGREELCANKALEGKLEFLLDFPDPSIAGYAPPFRVNLVDETTAAVVSSVRVPRFGTTKIAFDVDAIQCGPYRLEIDKTFTTPQDARHLGAIYVDHHDEFKFIPERNRVAKPSGEPADERVDYLRN